ncbi:MAG: hypothetical protein N2484_06200 [Clostridia bacterium]|nr:hypothetical protein [Clostridia bacterium]
MINDRKCRCMFCGNMVDSDENLPYFKYRPLKVYDTYFCGCMPSDAFVDAIDLLEIE